MIPPFEILDRNHYVLSIPFRCNKSLQIPIEMNNNVLSVYESNFCSRKEHKFFFPSTNLQNSRVDRDMKQKNYFPTFFFPFEYDKYHESVSVWKTLSIFLRTTQIRLKLVTHHPEFASLIGFVYKF